MCLLQPTVCKDSTECLPGDRGDGSQNPASPAFSATLERLGVLVIPS